MGFQRDVIPLVRSRADSPCRGWGRAPQSTKRSAQGELKNSPVDCFSRGNALQERAFLFESITNIEYIATDSCLHSADNVL